MKKSKIIILSLVIALVVCAAIGVTLYFTIWNKDTSSGKTNLTDVITITEVNGNEVNDEDSVFNKILELHKETGITEQDIEIKENSFQAADNNNPGAAIVAAQKASNFIGEVDITITPLSEKIDLSQQSLEYLAKVVRMDKIIDKEATTIKTELGTNITNKMKNLNLEAGTDYQISDNLNDIKADDNLNNYINHITIDSLATSEKATGSFTVTIHVQEDISKERTIEVGIDANQVDGLDSDSAKSIQNYIEIQVQKVLTKGQTNIINTDYWIINLDYIKEGAKFADYNGKVSVKGISNQLTGEFLITFIAES